MVPFNEKHFLGNLYILNKNINVELKKEKEGLELKNIASFVA